MKKTFSTLEPLEARIAPATLIVTNLADSGDGSLRAMLGTAQDGDVVTFASGLHGIVSLNDTLDVALGVTIKAAQAGTITLSGKSSVQIMSIDDGDDDNLSVVSLQNLSFVGGSATSSGGAIVSQESLVISGCTFFDNHSTATNGGAIAEEGSGATVKLLNSKFFGNTASNQGGAVDFTSISGLLIAKGSTFKDNSATNGGAVSVSSVPRVQLTDCKISGNTASQVGGGVYLSGVAVATFTNDSIADNVVTGTASNQGGAGIGLHASTLRLNDSVLSGNNSAGAGGGLLIDVTAAARLDGSTVSGNTAQWGGGIDFAGNLKMIASKIAQNIATKNGGGLYSNANGQSLDIDQSFITGNLATGSTGGGLYLQNSGSQLIQHTHITNNAASISGGGLAATNGNLNVSHTSITKNGAGIGGGVYLFSGTTTLNDHFATSNISGNSAVNQGGGLYIDGVALNLKTTTIASNNAATSGGGLYVNATASAIVTASTLRSNSAATGGGLTFLGTTTIGSSHFVHNLAYQSGGGIYGAASVQDFVISNSQISGNQQLDADGFGGGLCLLGSGKQTVLKCTITNNHAAGDGGGLAAANGVLNVIATNLKSNDATLGGGSYLFRTTNNVSASFTDSTVTKNHAITLGGGIYSATISTQTLSGTNVFGNTAPGNPDLLGNFLQS